MHWDHEPTGFLFARPTDTLAPVADASALATFASQPAFWTAAGSEAPRRFEFCGPRAAQMPLCRLPPPVCLALQVGLSMISRHGMAEQSRNLDQFIHPDGARNYSGHRQHRVYFHSCRQTAAGTAAKGAADRARPRVDHARAVALRPGVDGQADVAVGSRSHTWPVEGAASGVWPRLDSHPRWIVPALEKHARDS